MIFSAQNKYKTNLAGKTFMYVYGENYFEVQFRTKSFKHLTGIGSTLSPNQFYNYANKHILTLKQFYFSSDHPFRTAKNKLKQLEYLDRITKEQVCILTDIETKTCIYQIGLTNLSFTLCLIEDVNSNLNSQKSNTYYVPKSLRVKDKSIEKSGNGEFIDFIFEKSADDSIYDKLNFSDPLKRIPECLKGKIDDRFYFSDTYNAV